MIPFSAAVIDALNRPEAQTRWECLDILTTMVDHDSRTCDKAVPGAETALFDEEMYGAFGGHAVPLQAGRYDGEPF